MREQLRVVEVVLEDSEAVIVPIGDMHIGTPLFDRRLAEDVIGFIKDTPNAYAVIVGDIINAATKTSISNIYEDVLTPQESKKLAVKLLKPISNKILAVVSGNHDKRIWKESGSDVVEDIAMILGVEDRYDHNGILLQVKTGLYRNRGKLRYTLYMTHGTGGGRTSGSKINVLKRASEIVLADVYIIGHVHTPLFTSDVIHVPAANGKIIEFKRFYVSTASFLRWGEYAEEKMLSPSAAVFPKIVLSGTERRVDVWAGQTLRQK